MVSADTTTDQHPSSIEWVALKDVFTDHDVNTRPIDFTWVERRISAFDPDKLGVPVVSRRTDGRYACLDGQNRIELCRRAGYGDSKIECQVFHGLTTAEEANLFLGRNDSRQVGAFHKFVARITAGDADAVYIAAIVQRTGWELAFASGEKKIAAVGALEAVWKSGRPDETGWRGAYLEATLNVISEAWGHSADAANGHLIRGIGAVIATPTAAPPAWMLSKYPEVLRVTPDGRRGGHAPGRRYSVVSSRYREFCARISNSRLARLEASASTASTSRMRGVSSR